MFHLTLKRGGGKHAAWGAFDGEYGKPMLAQSQYVKLHWAMVMGGGGAVGVGGGNCSLISLHIQKSTRGKKKKKS